ncbi:hypothetical protein ACHWQZ_G017882 [Mnemiopsis leidyi]
MTHFYVLRQILILIERWELTFAKFYTSAILSIHCRWAFSKCFKSGVRHIYRYTNFGIFTPPSLKFTDKIV